MPRPMLARRRLMSNWSTIEPRFRTRTTSEASAPASTWRFAGLDGRKDAHGRESTPGFPPTYTAPVGGPTWDIRGPQRRDQVRRLRIGERGCGPVLRHVRQSPQPERGQANRRRGDEDHRLRDTRAGRVRRPGQGRRSARPRDRRRRERPRRMRPPKTVATTRSSRTSRRPPAARRSRAACAARSMMRPARTAGSARTSSSRRQPPPPPPPPPPTPRQDLAARPRARSGSSCRRHRPDRRARARREARCHARTERTGIDGPDPGRRRADRGARPSSRPRRHAPSPRARCRARSRSPAARRVVATARSSSGRPILRRRRPRSSARPTRRRSILRSRATGNRSCTSCSPGFGS